MTTSFSRVGTANTYDSAVRNISMRQTALSSLQESLASGKRVVRASDDPTSAANAERALNRISRIATDQRALESQRNAITQAESTLGDVTDVLQRFRELVVSAGDGANSVAERKSIAGELQGLRDQVMALANTKDTNGLPLFGALGSALAPFVGPQATSPDYTFKGLPGQSASSEVAIPFTLDGNSAFMLDPDVAVNVQTTLAASNGVARTTPITVASTTNPATASLAGTTFKAGSAYTITIDQMTLNPASTGPSNTGYAQYTINGIAPDGVTPVSVSGQADFDYNLPISIDIPDADYPGDAGVEGLQISLKGDVRLGDSVTLSPVVSVFSVLDNAIRDIGGASNTSSASKAVTEALTNIDLSMARVSAVRGQAGDLMNRADRISSNQESRSVQLEADRSRAEDLDMVQGISDFNNQQTGYSAALQTYAKVQQLSLFNYIS